MEIIFVSNLLSDNYFNKLFKDSKRKPEQQIQRFNRLLLEGFIQNGVSVKTISAPSINKKMSENLYFRFNKETQTQIQFNHLIGINVIGFKHLLYFIQSFILGLKFLRSNKNTYLICDVLYISVSAGAILAAKICGAHTIGIVTDLPSHLKSGQKKITNLINDYLINQYKSYILLTEEMKNLISLKNKNYVVLEGFSDITFKNEENLLENKNKDFTIVYAGSVEKRYGIEYMVKGFILAKLPDSRLDIFGSGSYEKELKEICDKHDNIYFHGVVKNRKVIEYEKKAHLLVNPRFSNELYTKYSFPSKNIEYLSTGTATLITKLPGVPNDYFDYVFTINPETSEGFSGKLLEIYKLPLRELHEKGLKGKEFVLKYKNNVEQVKKIIDIILI